MHVFALATNQHLNLGKSKLLPLGDWPVVLPSSVHGFEVVKEVTSLGVTFSNDDEPPPPDWADFSDKFESKCQRISNLQLSAFGRAFAVGTYGTSSFFHALEFSAPLPSTIAESRASVVKRLVDLNIPPSKKPPRQARHRPSGTDDGEDDEKRNPNMPGIHSSSLFGSPSGGGFGLLPLEEHVRARWFMQARRFILWSVGLGGSAFAPKALLSLRRQQEAAVKAGQEYVPTPEEKLLLKIQPSKPIWIDIASAILSKISPAHPVDSLLNACRQSVETASEGCIGIRAVVSGPLRRWSIALAALGPPTRPNPQLRHLSNLRYHPSPNHPIPVSMAIGNAALVADIRQLHWPSAYSKALPLATDGALVSRATQVLLGPVLKWQQERRLENVAHALSSSTPSPPSSEATRSEMDLLLKRLAKVWKVGICGNMWKEIAWRLQVNGVKTAGGRDIALPCACGQLHLPPTFVRAHPRSRFSDDERTTKEAVDKARALTCKKHVFGDCEVAQAVLHVLRDALPAPLSPLLQPSDVWLLRLPPSPQPHNLNEEAWSLTCVLALHAMSRGHAFLYPHRHLVDCVSRASHRAVAWLAHLLADVTSSGTVPQTWKDLPPNQPFFRCVSDSSSPFPSSRLTFQMPLTLAVLPADL